MYIYVLDPDFSCISIFQESCIPILQESTPRPNSALLETPLRKEGLLRSIYICIWRAHLAVSGEAYLTEIGNSELYHESWDTPQKS